MNKEDIIMNAVFFGIVILSFALSFHMVNRGIEIDTTPLYWPETFPPDPEPDWEDSDEWHEMWYNKLYNKRTSNNNVSYNTSIFTN